MDAERPAPMLTRRQAVTASASVAAGLVIVACGGSDEEGTIAAPEATVEPTPPCGDHTAEQTEGPFFTPDSPERTDLVEAGVRGVPLVLTGRVLARDCRPLHGALLDFWQADGFGAYDNQGYRLRGHQFSDAEGGYRLATIVPGVYPGRTRHIHVKAQPPGGAVLTTQLYFPGEEANDSDGIFDPALLIAAREGAGGVRGRFDFVL